MIIVTGGEQGLGAEILRQAPLGIEKYNLPREILKGGSAAIEEFLNEDRFFQRRKYELPIIVNNYGVNHLSWIGNTEKADQEIINANLLTPYWVINALAKSGSPWRVVNVASSAHRVPMRCSALYCASKAGLVQMTRVMARELAPKGWVVNAIAPGAMEDTEMQELTKRQVLELRGWTEQQANAYSKSLIPMGRETDTTEVAMAVWNLIRMPDYVNGTVVEVMGGV